MTLHKWMRQAGVEAGVRSGTTRGCCRDARAQATCASAGAGERGPAPRGYLPLAGESAGKRPLQFYPLLSELAADAISVRVSLWVLKLSGQPYYRWRRRQVTQAEVVEAYRPNVLPDAHRDDGAFGCRLPAAGKRSCGGRRTDVPTHRVADLPRQPVVLRLRGQAGREQEAPRPARSRPPRRTGLHC